MPCPRPCGESQGWRPLRRQAQGGALLGLGYVGYGQSHYERSVERVSAALASYQEVGDPFGIITALAQRSSLYYIQGRLDEAFADQHGISSCLNSLGELSFPMGQHDQATTYWAEALELRRAIGYRHGVVAVVRFALGEQAFTTLCELGRNLPLDTALAMASQPVSTGEQPPPSPRD